MITNFMEVDLESIIPETTVGLDLYILRDSDPVLYRKGEQPFTESNRRSLLESGHTRLYIVSGDREKFQRYVEANMSQIITNARIPIEKKTKIVYETSTYLMQDLFDDPRSGDKIKRSKKLITHTVDLILSGKEATKQLLSLTAHDYYTYTHSVNVTIFGIALSVRILGPHSGQNFHELGNGFLLHDLGKSLIDPAIINKPSRLSDEEWRIMKRHPEDGQKLLESSRELSKDIQFVVMEHHERYGGGGYPSGKSGEEIHPFGRICCIADVFDALTTRRSYRKASSTYEALHIMKEYMKGHFDPEYLQEFILLLGE